MKRLTKNIWAIAVAVVMIMATTVTAMAAETGEITITPPDETANGTEITYSVYKVFDAVGNGTDISYQLPSGKTLTGDMPKYFEVDTAGKVTVKEDATDAAGELNEDAIAAIAAFVQGDVPVDTVITEGTTANTTSLLENGYYYISTTIGSVVSITSTNPCATARDKNTVPKLEKAIVSIKDGEVVAGSLDTDGKNALAQFGSSVSYSITVELGNGTQNVKFHDTLGTGLTYNNDVAVTGIDMANCTIETTPDTDDTLTISFKDGTTGTATITYSATVNSDALTVDTGKNTATVSYGHNGETKSTPSETHVYNAKFTVTSQDGNGNALVGAGFVIKNADSKYYQKNSNDINWVASIDDATEYISDDTGAVPAFLGLVNGTYTLIQKTAPTYYNAAKEMDFTVAEHDYTVGNLAQTATVVNNAGTKLPSTGGMGTTVIYILGASLALGASVVLITRKRMSGK